LNLTDAESNAKKIFEWYKKINSKPIYILLITIAAIILWIAKLMYIPFFYSINCWFISKFEINLDNRTVYTTLLFITTILSICAVAKIIYLKLDYLITCYIKIPYRFKRLTPDECNLLECIYKSNDGLDCQNNLAIVRSLENKKMIYSFRVPFSTVDSRPFYCLKDKNYGEQIEKLIGKAKETK